MLIKRLYPAILWALLIVVLSLAPQDEFDNKSAMDNLDKIVHLFLYALLVHLTMVGLLKQMEYKILHKMAAYVSITAAFFLGLILEILQGTVFVSRSIEFMDLLANTMGSLLGLVSFYMIYKTLKK